MSDEIEDLVIETGVDTLMNYLAENGKASCKEISKEIGVDKSRVENWGDALAEQDLVEKHHTLTSGLVLEYSKKNLEEAGRKKAEIESELDEKSEDLKAELSEKSKKLDSRREELLDKQDEIDEDEKEKAVQDTVDQLEDLEERIDDSLENDELDHNTLQLISEVERVLQQIEQLIKEHLTEEQGKKLEKKTDEAVSEVEDVLEKAEKSDNFEEEQQEIKKKLKAVKKLEQNIETARSKTAKSGSSSGLKAKLTGLIPVKRKSSSSSAKETSKSAGPVKKKIDESQKIKKKDVPEKTYQELVDENRVTEVMRKLSLIKEPDYQSILEAEKFNRDRSELTSYLEERAEDVR